MGEGQDCRTDGHISIIDPEVVKRFPCATPRMAYPGGFNPVVRGASGTRSEWKADEGLYDHVTLSQQLE